jgi:hypothetical protein
MPAGHAQSASYKAHIALLASATLVPTSLYSQFAFYLCRWEQYYRTNLRIDKKKWKV